MCPQLYTSSHTNCLGLSMCSCAWHALSKLTCWTLNTGQPSVDVVMRFGECSLDDSSTEDGCGSSDLRVSMVNEAQHVTDKLLLCSESRQRRAFRDSDERQQHSSNSKNYKLSSFSILYLKPASLSIWEFSAQWSINLQDRNSGLVLAAVLHPVESSQGSLFCPLSPCTEI